MLLLQLVPLPAQAFGPSAPRSFDAKLRVPVYPLEPAIGTQYSEPGRAGDSRLEAFDEFVARTAEEWGGAVQAGSDRSVLISDG